MKCNHDDSTRRVVRFVVASAILAGLAAIAAYAQIFSVLAAYDDEGYVMISLKSYLDGQPLYNQVYSQYGPAYYQFQKFVHRALDLPVTHDVTRFKTIAVWLAASGLSAWIVALLVGSRAGLWAAVAFLAAFFHLDKLCLEPGHPQELGLLATLVALVASAKLACDTDPHSSAQRDASSLLALSALAGVAAAIATLTKINVGALLTAAIVCSQLSLMPRHRWLAPLIVAALAGAISLPAIIASHAWKHPLAMLFPLFITGCCAWLALWTANRPWPATLPATALAAFLAAWTATAAIVIGAATVEGTSWTALWYGLVGQHARFADRFFQSPPFYWAAPALGLAALCYGAAVGQAYRRAKRPATTAGEDALGEGAIGEGAIGERSIELHPINAESRIERLREIAAAAAVALVWLCACGFFLAIWSPLRHGLEPRAMTPALLSFGPLIAWILVRPDRPKRAGRVHLAWTACLMPMIVYPTPGTQVELGSLGLLLAVIVIAADAASSRLTAGSGAQRTLLPAADRTDYLSTAAPADHRSPIAAPPSAAAHQPCGRRWGLAAALLTILLVRDAEFCRRYATLVPLALPGAHHLRLAENQARRELALAHYLQRADVDTFVFADHGHNRFYFWAETDPPNGRNATFWPHLFDESMQREIVRDLERHQSVLAIGMPRGEELAAKNPGPLRKYLDQNFTLECCLEGWQIYRRRPRDAGSPNFRYASGMRSKQCAADKQQQQ